MPTNDAPLNAEFEKEPDEQQIKALRAFVARNTALGDVSPLVALDALLVDNETLREDLDRIRSRCPACGGSGTHESIEPAHHPSCDGTCGALCPVPQRVRVRCDCIGAIERLLGDVAGVRDALE